MALRQCCHHMKSLLTRNHSLIPLSNQIIRHTSSLGCYDIVVVGGGIVGMATARQIKCQAPELSCALVEKENDLAHHQSGNNSGVIHAGIYYKPGSLKAKLCLEGLNMIYSYVCNVCVPYKKCGKLIIATDCNEVERLEELFKLGQQNNVPDLTMICGDDICKYEPAATGMKAIYSPHTGIIDYKELTRSFGEDFKKMKGDIHFCFEACNFDIAPESRYDSPDINKYPVKIFSTEDRSISASFVLTCTGLHSQKVATLSGGCPDPAIIPFRGEYLTMKDTKKHIIQGLIYPVPDPRFPFLGVHFTPTVYGDVLVGPNALLALKREGYKRNDFSISDIMEYVKYPGFRKLAWKYARYGMQEWNKSRSIDRQIHDIQKMVPSVRTNDLCLGPAGVRAQAVSESGNLVDDFIFDSGTGAAKDRILHCRNAPSPAATSSMAIAKVLAEKVFDKLNAPEEEMKTTTYP